MNGVLDLEALAAELESEATVVRVVDDFFEPGTQARVVRDVGEAELDAVVLGGNSAEHYSKSLSGMHLKERIADAGVNPNRIVEANLLEQVAWPHSADKEGARAKARSVLNSAVLRAKHSDVLEPIHREPRRAVLILGCTPEGLVAAQRLLQLEYKVVLAERGGEEGSTCHTDTLNATVGFVFGHPHLEHVDQATIKDGVGWVGDYEVTLENPSGSVTYKVGGMLIAEPDEVAWIAELRPHFKVDVDDEGRARSLSPETHPAETIDPGIMVVPVRERARDLAEQVAAADAAVIALVLQLSQSHTVHYVDTSHVDESLCGGCTTCVKTCAFGACSINKETGLSQVDVRRCRGCGKCVVGCPVGARDIISSPHDYLLASIRQLADTEISGDKVVGFLCSGCGYPAADAAGRQVLEGGATYPASFLPIRIPCGGRLDTLYVLEAFKRGFDGVVVFRCREGHCHNLIGNLDMDRRINLLRTVLRSRNIDDTRLRIVDIAPEDGAHFVSAVQGVFDSIGTLANGKGGPQ